MAMRRVATAAAALALAAWTAGCSDVVPGKGPEAASVISSGSASAAADNSYIVADITPTVDSIVGHVRSHDFEHAFVIGSGPPGKRPPQHIGVGDKLLVNVWESGTNGLFVGQGTKDTPIEAVVGNDGTVDIPYVGTVRAGGQSVESVRLAIQDALADKAVQPQVQVVVESNVSNSVSVVGDAARPGKVPITPNGTRILDAVAASGGSRAPSYDTLVSLKRGTLEADALLDDLFEVPANNVYLEPDDSILLSDAHRSFSVLGSTRHNEVFKFDARTASLAEGLAGAGGLSDITADRGGVFVFRFEDPKLARKVAPESTVPARTLGVPVVYRLDLNEPSALFLARGFELRDKDVIYVAEHPLADFSKFVKLITSSINAAVEVGDDSVKVQTY